MDQEKLSKYNQAYMCMYPTRLVSLEFFRNTRHDKKDRKKPFVPFLEYPLIQLLETRQLPGNAAVT